MVICLLGPTACGKTEAAIQFAEQNPCDIISVDSAMVYRGMDIGTAKPTAEELERAPHRLIDICDPGEPYSVGDFCRDAMSEIERTLKSGRIPLLVGGTMLYFWQLSQGFSPLPVADAEVRQQILFEADKKGWPSMHALLAEVDPVMAAQLNPNDAQRISRALEIYRQTGKTLSQWQHEQTQTPPPYDFKYFLLAPYDRCEIHRRIELRFDMMLKAGFLEEVKQLYERGDLSADLPSIRSVGYRQAWQYLSGEIDFETMREKAIVATRQLCKRQFTWLKRFPTKPWDQMRTKN